MSHASFLTTQRYIRYAELHQTDAYDVHLPLSLQPDQAGKPGPQQRENGGNDSGKPVFRIVGA